MSIGIPAETRPGEGCFAAALEAAPALPAIAAQAIVGAGSGAAGTRCGHVPHR